MDILNENSNPLRKTTYELKRLYIVLVILVNQYIGYDRRLSCERVMVNGKILNPSAESEIENEKMSYMWQRKRE